MLAWNHSHEKTSWENKCSGWNSKWCIPGEKTRKLMEKETLREINQLNESSRLTELTHHQRIGYYAWDFFKSLSISYYTHPFSYLIWYSASFSLTRCLSWVEKEKNKFRIISIFHSPVFIYSTKCVLTNLLPFLLPYHFYRYYTLVSITQ